MMKSDSCRAAALIAETAETRGRANTASGALRLVLGNARRMFRRAV